MENDWIPTCYVGQNVDLCSMLVFTANLRLSSCHRWVWKENRVTLVYEHRCTTWSTKRKEVGWSIAQSRWNKNRMCSLDFCIHIYIIAVCSDAWGKNSNEEFCQELQINYTTMPSCIISWWKASRTCVVYLSPVSVSSGNWVSIQFLRINDSICVHIW